MKKILVIGLVALALASCRNSNEYDLCVYGGSASGIMTAYSAACKGHKVVVIEPTCRIGGLTTGGLGLTDIGNKQVVKGLGLDFYRKLGAHYGTLEQWVFEPSVALEIIEEYASHPGITVVRNHHVCDVTKDGTRISEIKVADASDTLSFSAKCFVDCSYEGDLMALAGVSYSVGREDNSVYGETWNGVQLMTGHQLPDGIDPFVERGNPDSGLLPGVSDASLSPDGTGDSLLQAYNYRICLTDSLENMVPIEKPENYDPAQYELLLRLIEAQPEKRHLYQYFIWSKMPGRKTDVNNRGGFSTDMIGGNHKFPHASWEERQAIIQDHKDYTLGLLYFMGHDTRVPEEMRAEMLRWGLPKDEYVNTGNWTPQLYIRECRRMIGEYVAVQADCENKKIAPAGIAYAAYTMDSHNCQRVVIKKDGKYMVKNEGNVEIHGGLPYPISYYSLTPKREECTNLLVPICLSASHIAYGSIRMEPVFMCLGQVAGIAASMYIEDGLASVQEVDYQKINEAIATDPFMDGSQPDVLVDDSQAVVSGDWKQSTYTKAYGPTYYSGSEGFVEFSLTAPTAGDYALYTYQHRNQGDTMYDLGDSTILVHPEEVVIWGQTTSAWHKLKTVTMEKGQTLKVRVSGHNGSIAFADAMQLVRVK